MKRAFALSSKEPVSDGKGIKALLQQLSIITFSYCTPANSFNMLRTKRRLFLLRTAKANTITASSTYSNPSLELSLSTGDPVSLVVLTPVPITVSNSGSRVLSLVISIHRRHNTTSSTANLFGVGATHGTCRPPAHSSKRPGIRSSWEHLHHLHQRKARALHPIIYHHLKYPQRNEADRKAG